MDTNKEERNRIKIEGFLRDIKYGVEVCEAPKTAPLISFREISRKPMAKQRPTGIADIRDIYPPEKASS